MKKFRSFAETYAHFLPTAALIAGFITDSFTLTRPDSLFNNAILIFYLTLAGVGILILNLRREREETGVSLWLLVLIQFCFGSLASGLLVLYGRSGTLAGNWLFFLLLGSFLVGNEFARTRYAQVRAHLSGYFVLVLAYAALVGPIIANSMGAFVFVASTVGGLLVISLYLLALFNFAPRVVKGHKRGVATAVLIIFSGFNVLYFFNFIPPVPLALKDAGVFHDARRLPSGNYAVSYEKAKWYELFRDTSARFHYRPGDDAYCFSSVFAPVGLSTSIIHRWEYNTENGWQTESRIPFSISGGRDTGYRGFTAEVNLREGEWRCNVETDNGLLIGRVTFEAVLSAVPELTEGTR